jgi:starch synthase
MQATRRSQSRQPHGPSDDVRSVWMLSYECAGIAQAGGLGEAVGGLARTLVSDYRQKVTVILPSHGRELDQGLREAYGLREEAQFVAHGNRLGTNGVHYEFLSGAERGVKDGVEYVLVKGLDDATSRWLDDRLLYDHDLTLEKMALFSRTLKLYCEFLLSMQRRNELPDLIHANDWHMVPAAVAVRQSLMERGIRVPLVFTVHLLSRTSLPWHYASEDWCGIRDLPQQPSLAGKRVHSLSYRQVWEVQCGDSLEKFGCFEADYVTSVSRSYLTHDVMDYVGPSIKGKGGHIYNGCDWDPEQIRSTAFAEKNELMKSQGDASRMNRWDLRSFLLTQALGQVADVFEIEGGRTVKPFKKDGPMVLMTGRLSPQKGADLLLEAIPRVTQVVPDVRFVLFLLPSGDKDQMLAIRDEASAYHNNVRIIFVQNRPTYVMSYMAADVYAMPSRSEPFGISALEAMITGSPVVGTDVGGISETVLDISKHGDRGTGILVPSEDTKALADSLISLLLMMQIDEKTRLGKGVPAKLANRIPIEVVAQIVGQNPQVGSRIRENCRSRVEQNFRWKNAGRTALAKYHTAMTLVASSPSRGNSTRA